MIQQNKDQIYVDSTWIDLALFMHITFDGDRMQGEHGFPQFPSLPAEIRRQIWECCLPQRLVAQGKLHMNNLHTTQRCQAWKTPTQPHARPLVKAVCREAWDAVEANGVSEGYPPDEDAYGGIWFQPKRDTMQMYWTTFSRIFRDWRSDEPHGMFSFQSNDLNAPISIMGEPFAAFPPGDPESSTFKWPFLRTIQNTSGGNVAAADLTWCLRRSIEIDMVVDVISFHIPDCKAAESGLFGLLGDAPVQTVAYDDVKQIRKFEALFEATRCLPGTDELDDAAAVEIEYVLSPTFRAQVVLWKEMVEWVLMAQMWLHDWMGDEAQSNATGAVWKPAIAIGHREVVEIPMNRYKPGIQ